MALDLSSFRKALASLEEAVAFSAPEADEHLRNIVRAGVVKNFEFTYELCWEFMKRWLETNVEPTVADGVTRRELFRLAAEQRLIDDVDAWMSYHEARNQTSQRYDAEVAEMACLAARDLFLNARALLTALEARND